MEDSKTQKKNINSVVEDSKKAILNVIDLNNNGQIDIEDVILAGFKVPGIKINRADFLRKELLRNHSEEKVSLAISTNPTSAGISTDELDKIADNIIQSERVAVSGISAALGTPGAAAMIVTIPTDIAQFYGYMLRTTQKLLYLYGFPQLNLPENDTQIDSGTMNEIILCMGVMYGVAGANKALLALAHGLAIGVEKKLLSTALTKGTIYPMIKSIVTWFGIRLNKQIFAGFFKKSIPVVGGIAGGAITYLSFKPCCDRLKSFLKDTSLSNPNYKPTDDEIEIYESFTQQS